MKTEISKIVSELKKTEPVLKYKDGKFEENEYTGGYGGKNFSLRVTTGDINCNGWDLRYKGLTIATKEGKKITLNINDEKIKIILYGYDFLEIKKAELSAKIQAMQEELENINTLLIYGLNA